MAQEIQEQHSLFPTRDSVEEVVQEGLAQLPIQTPNALIALLQLHGNTVVKLTSNQKWISPAIEGTPGKQPGHGRTATTRKNSDTSFFN